MTIRLHDETVGEERSRAYVLAVLGSSPEVLSELLWWLVVVDHATIVGVEVWTTRDQENPLSGHASLCRKSDIWTDLRTELGPLSGECIFPGDLKFPARAGRNASMPRIGEGTREWQTIILDRDGFECGDIRNDQDARALCASLHDRLRGLRSALPGDVEVVGCIAGGRKTMSAALQSAFELQARTSDRLIHVLVHPKLEGNREFRVPSAKWEAPTGVPVLEQVTVHEVPFPRVRTVLERLLGERERRVFEDRDFESLFGHLETSTTAKARLWSTADKWWFSAERGVERSPRIELSVLEAQLFVVMKDLGTSFSTDELLGRLNALVDPRALDAKWEINADGLKQRRQRLRDSLAPLRVGFEEFIPSEGRRVAGSYRFFLPGAAAITVENAAELTRKR